MGAPAEDYARRAQERFWSKVDKSGGPDACWPWTASRQPTGYGQFRYRGTMVYAHRFAMGVVDPTPGLEACHSCGNRLCCNPGHLRLGTSKENTQDMFEHGTLAREARHGRSKLDDSAVRLIREEHSEGKTSQRELSRRHGISEAQVSRIVNRKNWEMA